MYSHRWVEFLTPTPEEEAEADRSAAVYLRNKEASPGISTPRTTGLGLRARIHKRPQPSQAITLERLEDFGHPVGAVSAMPACP